MRGALLQFVQHLRRRHLERVEAVTRAQVLAHDLGEREVERAIAVDAEAPRLAQRRQLLDGDGVRRALRDVGGGGDGGGHAPLPRAADEQPDDDEGDGAAEADAAPLERAHDPLILDPRRARRALRLRLGVLLLGRHQRPHVDGERVGLDGAHLPRRVDVRDRQRRHLELARLVGGDAEDEAVRAPPVAEVAPALVAVVAVEQLQLAEVELGRQHHRDPRLGHRAHRQRQAIAHVGLGLVDRHAHRRRVGIVDVGHVGGARDRRQRYQRDRGCDKTPHQWRNLRSRARKKATSEATYGWSVRTLT